MTNSDTGPITGFPCDGLRQIRRFITSRNKEGEGVFAVEDEGAHHRIMVRGKGVSNIIYSTKDHQVDMNDEKDIGYARDNEPGVRETSGTVARMIDVAPGAESPMHRSASLDYAIVIESEFELTLDSGQRRILLPGDICVNRGVTHKWRNTNPHKYGRVMFVLLDIKPLYHDGQQVCDDLGDLYPPIKQ